MLLLLLMVFGVHSWPKCLEPPHNMQRTAIYCMKFRWGRSIQASDQHQPARYFKSESIKVACQPVSTPNLPSSILLVVLSSPHLLFLHRFDEHRHTPLSHLFTSFALFRQVSLGGPHLESHGGAGAQAGRWIAVLLAAPPPSCAPAAPLDKVCNLLKAERPALVNCAEITQRGRSGIHQGGLPCYKPHHPSVVLQPLCVT